MPSQPYFFNNINILNQIFDSKNEFIIILKDKNSKYEFLLDPLNVSTFEESGMVINIFLMGNPIAANLVLQEILDIPGSFSEDKDTNLDYVLLLITMENHPDYPNGIVSQAIFMGNTQSFLLNDEESCIISINHAKQEVIHKIDEKYLPEINIEQSNQNELDSSKQSYIRNKFGDLMVAKCNEDHDYGDDYFSASIELGTYNSERGSANLGAITIDHPFPTYQLAPKYLAYDITLNGITYYQCPITYCCQVMGLGSTLTLVGNPGQLVSAADLLSDFVIEGQSFEDNGLPFLFSIDWNEDDPFGRSFYVTQELYDSLGSTLTIKMVQSQISMITRVIPEHYLPNNLRDNLWCFDTNKNSIFTNTSYGANGINSIAIGPASQVQKLYADNAQGIAAIAMGNGVKAQGNASLAINYNTLAAGLYSFASGNQTKAQGVGGAAFGFKTEAGNYSLVGGFGTKSTGSYNLAFGKYGLATGQYGLTVTSFENGVTLPVTRPDEWHTEIIFDTIEQVPAILNSEYTLYWKFTTESEYRELSYSKYNNGLRLVINHSAISIPTSQTTINIVAQSQTAGLSSVNLGQSNRVLGNTSMALGKGLVVQTDDQFVIGKYNEINDNNIFAIGNGTGYTSRSNAFAIDTNGNISAAGSMEVISVILSSPSGIKFKVTVDDNGILTSTEITE